MELEAALQTFLPACSLLDIVWLTNASTRFTRHFGPISGLDAKLDRLHEKHCAAVFAMGSGMGVTQGARYMHGLVSTPTLALINRGLQSAGTSDSYIRRRVSPCTAFRCATC